MTKEQFEAYLKAAKPGSLIFFQGGDFIGKVIWRGQEVRTPGDPFAKFSHVAFVDAEGNISESTIELQVQFDKKFPFIHFNYVSGVKISPPENIKQLYLTVCHLKGITAEQIVAMSNEGKRLRDKKMFYPVLELFGTLMINVAYAALNLISFINPKKIKEWQEALLDHVNPFDEKRGMYCCAYVNHCAEKAWKRLIPKGMDESVCMVNDVHNPSLISEEIPIVVNGK